MTGDRRFDELTFEGFRHLASDASLSRYEKIGFPDSYREGYEELIFRDLDTKLPALGGRNRIVLDIGPGCSDLPVLIRDRCVARNHTLLLVDSEEMLAHHGPDKHILKFAGRFPECHPLLVDFVGRVDAIIAYSVLHYVFPDSSIYSFLDRALELLAHGGQMLIGDIPNASKRRRFLSSPAGRAFHRRYASSEADPVLSFDVIEHEQMDDSVLLGLAARARAEGFDAYLIPQADGLPMANRREDLLVCRP